MPVNTPAQVAGLAVDSGVAKIRTTAPKALVGGFLAGAYIAFGGLLAVVVTAGMDTARWGGLITLFTGLVFSLGLVLVVIGGADLLTGNMMLGPIAALRGRVTWVQVLINWVWVAIGNLAGSLFVAYVVADKTGVVGTAMSKAGTPAASAFTRLSKIALGKAVTEGNLEVFLRAIACNWLVCLGVWLALAATEVGGKVIAIVFPITAFVAIGFDHVVANMFFLPLAMFVHSPGITFAHTLTNLVLAFVGNAIGAALFVGGAYWYLYLKDAPETDGSSSPQKAPDRPARRR